MIGGYVANSRFSLAAFAVVISTALSNVAYAASPSFWSDVDESRIASRGVRTIVPAKARTMALNFDAMREALRASPKEGDVFAPDSAFEVSLPLPEGGFERFRVVESSVMDSELAKRYPNFRTYLGQGIDDPTATARFDLTNRGFRAQVIGATRTRYIEPYQSNDLSRYSVFNKSDYGRSREGFVCGVTGKHVPPVSNLLRRNNVTAIASGATLRTYRLALAATAEYTAAVGGTVSDALSAMVTTMNRVNGIYERELSVRMVLVANTDRLIYTNSASDPYTNNDGGAMLDENQANVDTVIGSANYDIGHVFSTGGGGVAYLESVCASSIKAGGVTGSGNPTGDAFDIDYVAHEMGHQFGGEHTFNGSTGNCGGGNRATTAAYEPGSGITIQAYAGICGATNLQPNSEDYFHRKSLDEMLAFTTGAGGGASCGTTSATMNTPPIVNAGANYTIPIGTPFTLTATGSDGDGDSLTYLWEQFNLGADNASATLIDNGGPLFRNFIPVTSPSRTFPSLRYILNNANVVAPTAPIEGTTTPAYMAGELLPTTARTMNFRVTARDNRAGGGGVNDAAMTVTTVATAGPFAVTAPNTAVSWVAGSTQTVSWNIASTNVAPVSVANVKIDLSLDGGYTYPTTLQTSVPNNGSASVTIPAGTPATTQARVRVSAVGNIFFDVSDVNFTITGTNTPPTLTVGTPGSVSTRQGSPAATAVVATVADAQDAAGALTVSVSQIPPELSVTAANSGGNVSLTATAACSLVAPTSGSKTYPVLLTVTDSGGASTSRFVNVLVGANREPVLGTYGSISLSRGNTSVVSPSSAPSDPDNNFASLTVSPSALPGSGAGVNVSIAPNGNVTVASDATSAIGPQIVRATATDTCGATITREFTVNVIPVGPFFTLGARTLAGDNSRLDPNDCNTLSVLLNNIGTTAATAATAVLTSTTPGVLITQPLSSYGTVAQAGSASNATAFQISTPPSLVPGSVANFVLTTSIANGPTQSFTFSLPVGVNTANYVFTSGTGATIPAGGTLIAGSATDDDIFSVNTPAGFNFSAYGTAVPGNSLLRVTTNGVVQIGAGGSRAYSNASLPNAGTGNAGDFPSDSFGANATVYFPNWNDLQLNPTGGGIYTNVVGAAPNRQFIIEWRGRTISDGASTINLNFALVFTENSDSFEYRYVQAGGGAAVGGAGSTVGVQAATTGTQFTQYSFNQAAAFAAGTRLTAVRPAATPGPGVCVAPAILNVDDSSAPDIYASSTDAVIVLRYLFGVRGNDLIAGLAATNPLRSPAQIETHLATNLARLDVDGDGVALATTDGVMILRRLLGLSGAALTSGVKNSTRSDAEIANVIDAMKP
jgi:Metallo-peptidase family M12B Reprolysin-like